MASTRRNRKVRWLQKPNALTSLALVFPCLLAYELGVLSLGLRERNGVDLLTDELGTRIGYDRFGLLLIALFVVLILYLRRRERFELGALVPVLVESSLYAFLMGSVILLVMSDLLGMKPRLVAMHPGPMPKLVLALGAGIHEELLFRWVGLGGLFLLAERMGLSRRVALPLAFCASAALFSAAHHLGPYGDPFSPNLFIYRFLAGLLFGALYWFRGFPVAVYTHALYDIHVMVLR